MEKLILNGWTHWSKKPPQDSDAVIVIQHDSGNLFIFKHFGSNAVSIMIKAFELNPEKLYWIKLPETKE